MNELRSIMEKFAASGWELLDIPCRRWLEGKIERDEIVAVIRQADAECGSCGCDFDPLYKRALELL